MYLSRHEPDTIGAEDGPVAEVDTKMVVLYPWPA